MRVNFRLLSLTSDKVQISATDIQRIRSLTLCYIECQTGGALLGKRLDEHTTAVELVMGPGLQAQHYKTDFIQDEVYVQKAGSIAIFELELQQVRVSSRSRKFPAVSHLAINLFLFI